LYVTLPISTIPFGRRLTRPPHRAGKKRPPPCAGSRSDPRAGPWEPLRLTGYPTDSGPRSPDAQLGVPDCLHRMTRNLGRSLRESAAIVRLHRHDPSLICSGQLRSFPAAALYDPPDLAPRTDACANPFLQVPNLSYLVGRKAREKSTTSHERDRMNVEPGLMVDGK
jgi:hypothetical protein